MSTLWTHADAAAATGGVATAPFAASGVSIDTRSLRGGDLFVALGGTRDGHAFVSDAFARGAAAAMGSTTHANLPANLPGGLPLLRVADTLAGLRGRGAAARARSAATAIGITGSVGKTGTKEALAAVLAAQGPTHAAAASFNNHIGVPLTLARMPPEARYAVLEIGMNHPGEISPLARLARLDVAVITTVEAVHIEFFESEDGIADEKASIMDGLAAGGAVVLNRDNRPFPRLSAAAAALGSSRVLTFGSYPLADVRLLAWEATDWGISARVAMRGRELPLRLGSPGVHAARNACAVLAATFAAGADPEAALPVLASLAPASGRGRRRAIPLPGGEATLIDDSYNASPPSVRAALAGRAAVPAWRRIVVLGYMR